MKQLPTWVTILLTVGLLLAAWTGAAWWFRPEQEGGLVLLPSPLVVLREWYALFAEHEFITDVWQSTKRVLLGMLASTIPAFILGVWFGVNRRVYSAAGPLFAFAKYIPPVAFVPILILWLGIGLSQQIALLFLGTFFYLTVMVAETVASTPQTYRDAALTLGVRRRQIIWRVLIPHSMPEFIMHLRTMVGIAWTYLTVAEMVATEDGIGRVIINSQRYLQTGRVLAGMLTIGVLGVLFDLALRGGSKLLCRWKEV